MIDSSVLHFLACVSTTLEYSKDTNGFLCLTGVSRSMLRPSDKAKKALHSSYFCLTAFLVSKSSHLGCSCQVPNQIHNYHFFFFFRGENAVAMITKKSRKVKTKCLGRKKKAPSVCQEVHSLWIQLQVRKGHNTTYYSTASFSSWMHRENGKGGFDFSSFVLRDWLHSPSTILDSRVT